MTLTAEERAERACQHFSFRSTLAYDSTVANVVVEIQEAVQAEREKCRSWMEHKKNCEKLHALKQGGVTAYNYAGCTCGLQERLEGK